MPKKDELEDEGMGSEEEEISIDMSQAKTFEPLPERKPFLAAVSKWKYGRTPNGRKLDYEFTVVEPADLVNRKVQESVSLENEFTLGRFKQLLSALGLRPAQVKLEEKIEDMEEGVEKQNLVDELLALEKAYKAPKEVDTLGLQATIFCRTRKSDAYGDRSNITRFRPASSFKEATAATY